MVISECDWKFSLRLGPAADRGSGRPPGEGNGSPLQYSCLENPHGQRSLVGYSPWGCKELNITDQLNIAQQVDTWDFLVAQR